MKDEFDEVNIISVGSSLKLCLVTEEKARVYPRFAPTMGWDTGAGQAIVEFVDGKVIQVEINECLRIIKKIH